MADTETATTPLFAIFAISLLSLFLIPFTIYKLCNAAGSDDVVKPWELAGKKKKGAVGKFVARFLTPTGVGLLVGWGLLFVLLWYVQQFASELAPFDPFAILKLDRSATEQDVKKAFRRLSLQYHPDKNSDPAAAPVFLQISQAYKALTDDVARKNYELYGHPDGKQAIEMGIALPSWLMGNDKNGPLVLAVLVGFGVLLPLCFAAWFLFSSSKLMGPNQIMHETVEIYFRTKFGVKESQSVGRIPDTLVMAMEFIQLPTPAEHGKPLEELRKEILRTHPDLKEKPQFFKRKLSLVKVHMLLLAYMDRIEIPPILKKDLEFVLRKSPLFLEEMVKIANVIRSAAFPFGWLTPTIGAVEMLQCLTQAVSINARKTLTPGKVSQDSQAPMLQLPHMDMDIMKKMSRKRVRSLGELLVLEPQDRLALLKSCGLTAAQADEVVTSLHSIPVVTVTSAGFLVEGEDPDAPIMEEDVVTCSLRLLLSRPAHRQADFVPPKGNSVQAYAPLCPVPREEKWYIILADPLNNAVLAYSVVSLVEAEAAGLAAWEKIRGDAAAAKRKENGSAAGPVANGKPAKQEAQQLEAKDFFLLSTDGCENQGQTVELKLRAPRQGKYDLTLYVVSDCWIGCDRIQPLKLKVNELTRAEREGRTHRGKVVPLEGAEDNASDRDADEADSEEEDDEDEEGGYDSEESSTEESGSEAGEPSDGDESETTEAPPLLKDVDGITK